ncbi:MAG: PD-(D/E)XK nuclease family protein [Bacteroidota bacterium]
MPKKFLEAVAENMLTRGNDLSRYAMVFPNRRAMLYFKDYLRKQADKPVWAPEMFTVNDFFQRLSGLRKADTITLIFTIYNLYKKLARSPEPFDDFYFWGEMILADFDDLDKYLVNAGHLFTNLESLKEMEAVFSELTEEQYEAIRKFWSHFDASKPSDQKEEFLAIWQVLAPLYDELNVLLRKQGVGYEGMIAREVIAQLDTDRLAALLHWEKVALVGFNALNACEKKLFTHLKHKGKALFYWDYDEFYVARSYHRAGQFVKENLKAFPAEPLDITFDGFSQPKKVKALAVPSEIGQAKIMARELLNNPDFVADPTNSGIILADEGLFIPCVNAIPGSAALQPEGEEARQMVNITMGYPMAYSAAFSFLEHVMSLQQQARKYKDEWRFAANDVLALLHHQYLFVGAPEKVQALKQKLVEDNMAWVRASDLAELPDAERVFRKLNGAHQITDYLLALIRHVEQQLGGEATTESTLQREYLFHLYLNIQRLGDIVTSSDTQIRLETYWPLLRKVIGGLTIPFEGEPLEGIQLMGVLETRALDFDRLIILSMNEGKFPKAESAPSFVPHTLRLGFGMPTVEYQDAIFAYYFYRLIQRAGDITFIYNNSQEGMQKGEMSRFLAQLKYDSPIELEEQSVTFTLHPETEKTLEIAKDTDLQKLLEAYIDNGQRFLSPSALATYVRCPMQFYFRYMAGIKERDELTEDVDLPVFGSILHETIDQLYQPFVGQTVDEAALKQLLANEKGIVQLIDTAFEKEFLGNKEQHPLEGKNLILRDIILHYIKQAVRYDMKFTPFRMVSLEDFYKAQFPVQSATRSFHVNMGGKIDRVDEVEGVIRVIDYKTGKDKGAIASLEELFWPEVPSRHHSPGMQVLLYGWLFQEKYPQDKEVMLGLYYFRSMFSEGYDPVLKQGQRKDKTSVIYQQVKEEYLQLLNDKLAELFDAQTPFVQTDDFQVCGTCPYAAICHRN